MTSDEWLKGLDPEIRDQFLTIVNEVTLDANANVAKQEAMNRQRILDAGTTIRVLTPEQRKAWVETMKPVWTKFEGDIGTDLIEAAQSANNAS